MSNHLIQSITIKPEYIYDHIRMDFLLSNSADRYLLEVKSCTLIKSWVALFPDVPTSRGLRTPENRCSSILPQ